MLKYINHKMMGGGDHGWLNSIFHFSFADAAVAAKKASHVIFPCFLFSSPIFPNKLCQVGRIR